MAYVCSLYIYKKGNRRKEERDGQLRRSESSRLQPLQQQGAPTTRKESLRAQLHRRGVKFSGHQQRAKSKTWQSWWLQKIKKERDKKSCKCKKNPAVTLNSEVPRSLQVVFSAGFIFPFLLKLILPPPKEQKARNQHNLHVWFSIRQVIRQQASQSRKHTNKLDTRIEYTLSHALSHTHARSLPRTRGGQTSESGHHFFGKHIYTNDGNWSQKLRQ